VDRNRPKPNSSPRAARILCSLLGAGLLVACRGDVVTTAVLTAPGTVTARFTFAKPVALWAHAAGVWGGSGQSMLQVVYEIDVEQGGVVVGHVSCSTSKSTTSVCEREQSVPGGIRRDCEVKLVCELPPLSPGAVVLRVTGSVGNPAHVTSLDNLSLVVRAK
jgi:hypothetical protein